MLHKLEAKSDRCLFVGYPKEILDIVSQHVGTKAVCFKVYNLLRGRVSSNRRQWEQG